MLSLQGRLEPPLERERLVGLTGPECMLYVGFCLDDGVLFRALTEVERYASVLDQPIAVSTARAITEDPRQSAAMKDAIVGVLTNPQTTLSKMQTGLCAAYRRGTTRRFLRWDRDPMVEGDLEPPKYQPVIGGPPPRAPGSPEWRRATLVSLLDPWFVPEPSTKRLRRITDGQIALVNLLQGRLAEFASELSPPKLAQLKTATVVNAERKAVALARQRRAPVTNLRSHPTMRQALAEAAREFKRS